MRFRSTRGHGGLADFETMLMDGLARDGGLYLPEYWPTPQPDGHTAYAGLVASVLEPLVAPDPIASQLPEICAEAYSAFRHPETAPLRPVADGRYLLELFWGPTLAFKDYALAVVGPLFDRVLSRRSRRVVVLGATSGDTGSAAIEACRGRANIDVVILFPAGRISEFQRRQMTTTGDPTVTAVSVAGTFDDCQALVKRAFADPGLSGRLAAVNSINFVRLAAQSAYYWWAAKQIGAPTVDFAVPTGNFGNAYSGLVARHMGAAVGRLVIGNNANRGLVDLVRGGRLAPEEVRMTLAPAMDIQIPSNLERYLFELADGDSDQVGQWQKDLRDRGLRLTAVQKVEIQSQFDAGWLADSQVREVMRRVFELEGLVLDPHTAISWEVGRSFKRSEVPQVVIATAHPVKFSEAVKAAIGRQPDLPPMWNDLSHRDEKMLSIANDYRQLRPLLLD
ncbi:MAG: threonine synthase [Actinomycetota bacterium]